MAAYDASSLVTDVDPAPRDVRLWWSLAAVALLVRFLIMPYGGFPVDIGTFRAWAEGLARDGPAAFYGAGFADYLPGYLYVLWVIGEIHAVVRFSDQAFVFALKVPAAVADVATAGLIFAVGRRFAAPWALALSASYLFHPGVIFNSAYWGQADAVGAVFALAGVATLGARSPILSAVLLTVGVIIKPQTAPAAIAAAIMLLRTLTAPRSGPPRWDLLLGAGAAAAGALVLVILPFGLSPLGLISVLRTALGVYPFGSVVAFNFWGLAQGFWIEDSVRWLGIPLVTWGGVATLLALVIPLVWIWRHPEPKAVILAAAVSLLITFVLPTRIHERYLLPAIPFFAAAPLADRRMVWAYVPLSVVFALNLLFAYTRPYVQTFTLPPWLEATVFSTIGTRTLSAIAVLCLGASLVLLLTWAGRGSAAPGERLEHRPPHPLPDHAPGVDQHGQHDERLVERAQGSAGAPDRQEEH
jgi:dolichyl-phosphate-mannose-protein mannosyltransferase